jgi:hypothetical protein
LFVCFVFCIHESILVVKSNTWLWHFKKFVFGGERG